MGRTARDKRPYVKPVQKIELSEKNVKRRIIFVALFLVLGVIAISRGVAGLLYVPEEWTQIKAESSVGKNCSDEFVLYYKPGQGQSSAASENRAVKLLYSNLCHDAYNMFSADEEIDDVNNIYYINRHPNEEVEIDAALYKAFEIVEAAKNRNIYLGPVYEIYRGLFFCDDQAYTIDYDPYQNEELAEEYKSMAEFANDKSAVNINLLGNNKIKLSVSDEYLTYAKENDINNFIDFSWMKNAFITDYIADTFIERGFMYGILSSYDGFSRSFMPDSEESRNSINSILDKQLYLAGTLAYNGSLSMVGLRAYGMVESDSYRYFTFSDGRVATMYLDMKDGKCKNALDQMTMCSRDKNCSQILMSMIPVYIADSFDESLVSQIKEKGITSVYSKADVIYYNGQDISITDLYDSQGVKFTASFIN